MSSTLDPKILAKLRAFAARRRKLIIVRGICTAVAMLLATMMIVAFVDLFFILPDSVRWGLSGAAYLAVIIAEWRTCLQLLANSPDPRRLARLVEHAEPKLREDLLSAVELGTEKEGEVFDSVQFRELVQSDVAARVEDVDVARLLPVNLLKRYLLVAAGICVAAAVAFALTGTQFGTLLMRALLPMANLARVSKFKIAVVEPAPAEQRVPHGETIPLVIQVSGGRTNKAVLETFSKSGGREVVQMTPLKGDRFSATIQVAREDMQYRVRAGDAITKKHAIDAEPRPHVARFEKVYTFPEYSRVAPKTVTEEHGDLGALEGSEVELRLHTDQRIKSAELHIEQARKQFTVPLQAGEGGRLSAKIPVSASGTYRVHLVAADTGFENKFSPEYEIRAEPDLVPQVELELPKQDLILPANEIVDVQGTASDDQSLAKVSQLIRINEGGWQEVPLAENPGAKASVDRRWDLYQQGVKPGDLITLKLLAVDLKGNKGESRPLQITVSAAGFESKRLQALEAQRALWLVLKELRGAADKLEKQAAEARAKFDQLPDSDPQRKQVVVSAATAQGEFEQKSTQAWEQFNVTLKAAGAGHESADVVLLGRQFSRLDRGAAALGRDALELVLADPAAAFAKDQMREFAEATGRAAQRARSSEDSYRTLLGSEEVDVISENMRIVAREQEHLTGLAQNSGDDAAKWAQLANRTRTVIAETRSLEQMMTAAAVHLPGGHNQRLQQLQKELEKLRTPVDKALTAGPLTKAVLEPTKKLAKYTGDVSRALLSLKSGLMHEPVKVTGQLWKEVQPTYTNFEGLRQEVRAITANDKLPKQQVTGPRLLFNAYDGDPKKDTPEQMTYQLNTLHVRQPSQFLKLGEMISGTKFKLQNFSYKTAANAATGEETDLSELTVVNTETNEPTVLPLARVTNSPPTFASTSTSGDVRAWLTGRRWTLRGEAFKQHGDLEEARIESDSYFVNDVRSTSLALGALHDAAKQAGSIDGVNDKLTALDKSFRLLESAHDLSELLDGLNHLGANERWDILNPRARTSAPRDWKWLEARLRVMPEELGQLKLDEPVRQAISLAQKSLWEMQKLPAWQVVTQEMTDRLKPDRDPMAVQQDVQKVAEKVKEALDHLRKPVAEAREQLAQLTPKLSEMMAKLAEETKALQAETTEQAEKAPNQNEQGQAAAEQLVAKQEALNEKIDTLKDALRSDANQQDILKDEGRERARDADDALAMLKEPPPAAEAALEQAAQSPEAAAQEQALNQAATEQQKLASALEQLAEHYQNAEQGKAQESRMALRAQEQPLGVKEQLDAQYAKAEQMADLAQASPSELLAQLEKALPENPLMQQELSSISENILANAEDALTKASAQENQIMQAVNKLVAEPQKAAQEAAAQQAVDAAKKAAQQAAEAAKKAAQAARAAEQSATAAEKQGEQTANAALDAKADQAADHALEAAQAADQAAQAAEQIGKPGQQAPQAIQAAQQASQKAGEAAQKATQAVAEAKEAQAMAQEAAQKGGDQKPKNDSAAQQAAQAAEAAQQSADAAMVAQNAANEAAKAMQNAASPPQVAQQPPAAGMKQAAQQAAEAAKKAAQSARSADQLATAAEKQGEQMANAALDAKADQAADHALEAAQAADLAAQAAEQFGKEGQPTAQALQAAQQAAQRAGEAVQKAQQAAGEAKEAQAMAQAEAQKGGPQQAENQSAAEKAGQAAQAAEQSAQAAQMAQNVAQQAAQAMQSPATPAPQVAGQPPAAPHPQLAQAAQQQPSIAAAANEAGGEVMRAGRHEGRLQNTPTAEQLQQLGSEIQETAKAEVPGAGQALAEAAMAADAQAAVTAASTELAAELQQLQAAVNPTPAAPASGQPQAQPATTPGTPQAAPTPAGQQAQAAAPSPAGAPASPSGEAPAGEPSGAPAATASAPPAGAGEPQGTPGTPPPRAGAMAATPASPQEQVWMARTLDALDAALNASASSAASGAEAAPSPAEGQAEGQQPGQPSPAMSQAQAAMAAAAQAAAAAMKASRAESSAPAPPGEPSKSEMMVASKSGARADGPGTAYGQPPDAKNLRAGEWGKLPKKVAEELTQGQRESVAGEYRNQIETYYRVIAERAKKQ